MDPRVTVALPGGRMVEGSFQARRQEADGRWVYLVCLNVPAAAVRPIEGQEYSGVPTERIAVERWVVEAMRHDRPENHAVVLYTGEDCWAAQGRLTPASTAQAKIHLREAWATRCEVCQPDP